jgi:hypothetical protein
MLSSLSNNPLDQAEVHYVFSQARGPYYGHLRVNVFYLGGPTMVDNEDSAAVSHPQQIWYDLIRRTLV